MSENNNVKVMMCPVCGKGIVGIHDYAKHMNEHSEEIKRKAEEEERQRKEDQKKVDTARLEKLKKMYEDAYSNYIKAKEKYIDSYGEDAKHVDLDGLLDFLSNFPTWRSWG